MSHPPLQALEVSKRFGQHTALDCVSLSVNAGEIFCLLGSNGAGKTTTLSLFLNLIEPSSGRVLVNGEDVVTHPVSTKARLAYLPENVHLYGHLSGLENLRYFASFTTQGDPGAEAGRMLLRHAGLPETTVARTVRTYSKGMRQKVGIAIAMAKDANALLLDEPTSGLDPKASNDFTDLMLERSAASVAILMATHDLYRAWECGHRFGIMREGRLLHMLRREELTLAELEATYLREMAGVAG